MSLTMRCSRMKPEVFRRLVNIFKKEHQKNVLRCFSSSQFKTETKQTTTQLASPNSHLNLHEKGHAFNVFPHEEFQQRRFRLMNAIATKSLNFHNSAEHHVVIIPSATKVFMSEKIPYIFHQNTDFYYTTGFKEPDSVLVLTSIPNKLLPQHKATIFVQNNDSHSALWDGPRTGVDGAVDLLGVDDALSFNQLYEFLEQFVRNKQNSVIWYNVFAPVNSEVHKTLTRLSSNFKNLHLESPEVCLHQLRLVKSPLEIDLMKRSCEIASDSFAEVMKMTKPKISEHVLHARVEYECKIRGADYLAYPPVVAGGNRANIIHYINNDQRVDEGDMVLMDAGCSFKGYSSDITRTWPVSGKFSPAQRTLYELLLEIQKDLIKRCLPNTSLNILFAEACQLLGKHLQAIGVIPQSVLSKDFFQVTQDFCPHHIGHYLGLDVHDSNSVSRNVALQKGMIITIEPGIYINESNKSVPKEFRGLGIRIEDNILITDGDPVNLTIKCPKNVHALEAIVSGNN